MDPTKKELYTTKRSSGIDCSDINIIETWELIKNDNNNIKWLLIGYLNQSKVTLINNGEDFNDLLVLLNDDECYFGVLRCKIDKNDKFFTFSFVGENVNGMKKGKASMHRSAILNLFEVHGTVSINGLAEANPTTFIQQIALQSRTDPSNKNHPEQQQQQQHEEVKEQQQQVQQQEQQQHEQEDGKYLLWKHELSVLASMGFVDKDDCIIQLERYSNQSRTSQEILQLAVFDLLKRS